MIIPILPHHALPLVNLDALIAPPRDTAAVPFDVEHPANVALVAPPNVFQAQAFETLIKVMVN